MTSTNNRAIEQAIIKSIAQQERVVSDIFFVKDHFQMDCQALQVQPYQDPKQAIYQAIAATMQGKRVSFLATGSDYANLGEALRWAAQLHLPLCLFELESGNSPSHFDDVIEVHCHSWQSFLHSSIAARRVAERGMTTVRVSLDVQTAKATASPATPVADQIIESFIGSASQHHPVSSPAQGQLFGDTRANVPAWYQLDRPMGLSLDKNTSHLSAHSLGTRVFFDDHLLPLIDATLKDLNPLIKDRLSRVQVYRENAPVRVMCAANLFASVVKAMRDTSIGVVAPTWTGRGIAWEHQTYLAGAEKIIVLSDFDRVHPTLRQASDAFTGDKVFGLQVAVPVHELAPFLSFLLHKENGTYTYGTAPPIDSQGSIPKWDMLAQAIQRDYPQLIESCGPVNHSAERDQARSSRVPQFMQNQRHRTGGLDDPARFWSESIYPMLCERETTRFPTPLNTLGHVPAMTSAFLDQKAQFQEAQPGFDPTSCSGCARCWVICPEAAIGATLLDPVEVVEFITTKVKQLGDQQELVSLMRRQRKQIAAKLNQVIQSEDARQLTPQHLQSAFRDWLEGSQSDSQQRAQSLAAIAQVTADWSSIACAVTPALYRDAKTPGAGKLLALAIDSATCKGCGMCVSICDDHALRNDLSGPTQESWSAWEALPDTRGSTIATFMADDSTSWAAPFMSRSINQAMAGGDSIPPASTMRLNLRHIWGLAEYQLQQQRQSRLEQLRGIHQQLADKLKSTISSSVSLAENPSLVHGMNMAGGARTTLPELAEQLAKVGATHSIDTAAILDYGALIEKTDRLIHQLSGSSSGQSRARLGAVLSSSFLTRHLRFPWNPFPGPVVSHPKHGLALALGIARCLCDQHLQEQQLIEESRRSIQSSPAQARTQVKHVTWSTCGAELRSQAPICLLIMDSESVATTELDAFREAFTCDLPIKLLYMDNGCPDEGSLPDLAMQSETVFYAALAGPFAKPTAALAALAFDGPALIHVMAYELPESQAHSGMDHMQLALDGRIHVPLIFDPSHPGSFADRLSMEVDETDRSDAMAAGIRWLWQNRGCPEPAAAANISVPAWLDLSPEMQKHTIPGIQIDQRGGFKPQRHEWQWLLRRWSRYQRLLSMKLGSQERLQQALSDRESELLRKFEERTQTLQAQHQKESEQNAERFMHAVAEQLTDRLVELSQQVDPDSLPTGWRP